MTVAVYLPPLLAIPLAFGGRWLAGRALRAPRHAS
jgi:hypothetical protein